MLSEQFLLLLKLKELLGLRVCGRVGQRTWNLQLWLGVLLLKLFLLAASELVRFEARFVGELEHAKVARKRALVGIADDRLTARERPSAHAHS